MMRQAGRLLVLAALAAGMLAPVHPPEIAAGWPGIAAAVRGAWAVTPPPRKPAVPSEALPETSGRDDRAAPPAPAAPRSLGLPIGFSSNLIQVTSGFTGAGVVLFGALEEPADVVAVLRGPEAVVNVRRKAEILGIWANVESVSFERAPAYYRIASTRPVEDLLPADVRKTLQIGVETLRLVSRDGKPEREGLFRAALIRLKQEQGLYPESGLRVIVQNDRLFQVALDFPSNVPVGVYQVVVYAVRDGVVAAAASTALFIEKRGFGATLYQMAHEDSIAYGLIAVLLALAAGWAADRMFRRS